MLLSKINIEYKYLCFLRSYYLYLSFINTQTNVNSNKYVGISIDLLYNTKCINNIMIVNLSWIQDWFQSKIFILVDWIWINLGFQTKSSMLFIHCFIFANQTFILPSWQKISSVKLNSRLIRIDVQSPSTFGMNRSCSKLITNSSDNFTNLFHYFFPRIFLCLSRWKRKQNSYWFKTRCFFSVCQLKKKS